MKGRLPVSNAANSTSAEVLCLSQTKNKQNECYFTTIWMAQRKKSEHARTTLAARPGAGRSIAFIGSTCDVTGTFQFNFNRNCAL
jgi:hypothetical protein